MTALVTMWSAVTAVERYPCVGTAAHSTDMMLMLMMLAMAEVQS